MMGTAVMLGAVLAAGPVLVGPVVGVLSRLLAGIPARLAAANAEQNPRRTAASAATLAIGLAVVSLVTTIAASVETTTDRALDKQFAVDYTVTAAIHDRPPSAELANSLAAVAQVETVAPRQSFTGVLNGSGVWLTAVRGDAVGTLVRPDVLSGRLDRLRPGEIAVSKQLAESSGFAVGQTVRAENATELRVVAVFDDGASGPGNDLGLGMVEMSTMATMGQQGNGGSLLVKLKPGVNHAEADAAVRAVVTAAPLARINSIADIKAQASQSVRDMLVLMWALIGLAVIIALAGIANTLSLSVLERTRESALLRALGLTISGLRTTLVIESVFVAAMGAAIGLLLGIGSAWLFTRTATLTFALPFGQIGVLLLAALMAAPLAALLPAHRATSRRRTSLVDPL